MQKYSNACVVPIKVHLDYMTQPCDTSEEFDHFTNMVLGPLKTKSPTLEYPPGFGLECL